MERSRSCFRSALRPTASAVCQKTTYNAVEQPAGPQWTRCHRCPTAFPSLTARWRNLPRVAALPQRPACLRLQPSGVVHPRSQSATCSTAIGNLPSPIQKTRAWALRLQPHFPEVSALGLLPAWVFLAALPECRNSPTRPSKCSHRFSLVQPITAPLFFRSLVPVNHQYQRLEFVKL